MVAKSTSIVNTAATVSSLFQIKNLMLYGKFHAQFCHNVSSRRIVNLLLIVKINAYFISVGYDAILL